jgi:hypothetical protein
MLTGEGDRRVRSPRGGGPFDPPLDQSIAWQEDAVGTDPLPLDAAATARYRAWTRANPPPQ